MVKDENIIKEISGFNSFLVGLPEKLKDYKSTFDNPGEQESRRLPTPEELDLQYASLRAEYNTFYTATQVELLTIEVRKQQRENEELRKELKVKDERIESLINEMKTLRENKQGVSAQAQKPVG